MKVLYISQGQFNDYECDMMFHGFRTVLGDDCVDVNRIWQMYKAGGGGYTVYGLLPDDSGVDRTDIRAKILNRYFDFIIYGSVWHSMEFSGEVLSSYPPNRVAFIDGLDDDARVMTELAGKGTYFKREPRGPEMPRLPIQFCVPKEKIVTDIPPKLHLMAPCDPRDRSTYTFITEESYHQQYRDSYFGFTMKKGGWDCLRHYEIIANGCMPYFEGLENCPPQTMFRLPRPELYQARKLRDEWNQKDQISEWHELMHRVMGILREQMTTEAMAKYVLDILVRGAS